MADGKIEYIIQLLKQGEGGAEAARDLEKLDKSGKQAGESVSGMGDKFKQLFAFLAGSAVLRDATREMLEGEAAVTRLGAALKSTGKYSAEYFEELQKMATQMSRATTFSDDVITTVIAKLTAMGAESGNIRQLTEKVLDLSVLFDRDLPRATMAMGRAIRGEFGAFTEMGIKLDENATQAEKFKSVMEQLGKISGGAAREMRNTVGGELDQLKKEWESLMEAIGKTVVAPAVHGVYSTLEDKRNRPGNRDELMADFKELRRQRAVMEGEVLLRERMGTISAKDAQRVRSQFATSYGLADQQFPKGGLVWDLNEWPDRKALMNRTLMSGRSILGGTAAPGAAGGAGEIAVPSSLLNADREKQLKDYEEEIWGEYLKQIKETEDLINSFWDEYLDDLKKVQQENEEVTKRAEEYGEEYQRKIEEGAKLETELKQESRMVGLEGIEAEMMAASIAHERRVAQIQQLDLDNEEMYRNLMQLEDQLHGKEVARINYSHSAAAEWKVQLKQLKEYGMQSFSAGLAGAMVDAFEEGGKAFQKFASNFLKMMAQMILQALILRAIRGIFGMGMAEGGQAPAMAAAGGVFGVNEVNGPTYFPKFNVLAGEAGREVMTVMARPRLVNMNGIMAQMGDVQGRRMAFVDAQALARASGARAMAGGGSTGATGGGPGGFLSVRIGLDPGLRGEIAADATKQTMAQVVHDMGSDTQLSRVTQKVSKS